MMRAFQKCIFIVIERLNHKLGPFKWNFAYFSRFYHDLSFIILKSRDHGCRFKNFLIPWFHIKSQGKLTNLKELVQKLQDLWTNLKVSLDRIGLTLFRQAYFVPFIGVLAELEYWGNC